MNTDKKAQQLRVLPRKSLESLRRVSSVKGKGDDRKRRRTKPRGVEARGFAELTAYVSTQALNGPPYMYFLYLIAAGCGVPVSEDALVCWIGACLALKQFTLHKAVVVLALTYLGVVLSDMITFYIGVMMERGVLNKFFPNFAESEAAKKAKDKVQQWGQKVGFMQRFCIGFRAPLCLMSGLVGVKPKNFFYGTSCGAVFSMSVQIFVGYLLRNTPNAYISTLALVAMPTLVGNVLGPMAMTLSAFLVKWRKRSAPKKDVNVMQQ
jgi:membrane protein DedA with SNARE-associated domain